MKCGDRTENFVEGSFSKIYDTTSTLEIKKKSP